MIHILVPACGISEQLQDNYWPKNVLEVNGLPMIQYVIENYQGIPGKRFIFLLNQGECSQFHTDSMVSLLTENNCDIIRLSGETGGALCTSLMAIQHVNNEDPLIICNNDQTFDSGIPEALESFESRNADCGVICFRCVHPRWSYVRAAEGEVVEASEKRPISRQAIAGFYYFRHGRDFVTAAKNAILKGRTYRGKYYLSAAINEMILMGRRVAEYTIPADQYHTFFEQKQIDRYEQLMRKSYADISS